MKKTPISSKTGSRAQEIPLSGRKSQKTLSASRNKEPSVKENSMSMKKSPTNSGYKEITSKFEVLKDSLEDITNLSFEPSVSDVDYKSYDIKLKSDNGLLYNEELYPDKKGGLERSDLEMSGMKEAKLAAREMLSMKRNLNEAQARAISATKELSKMQYEKSMIENQLRKAEAKCKELIDQKATDQARINELNYLNSQLSADMVKVKLEAQNNGGKTKENLEKIRKNLADVEEAIEKKNQKASKSLKKLKVMLSALEKLVESSAREAFSKCRPSFEKLHEIISKISEIVCAKALDDLRHIEDTEDYEALKTLNEVVYNYETENTNLRKELANLNNLLSKEQAKNRDVIPQYRESVARLKKNTQLVRDKLKDIQELRQNERIEFEQKIAALEETKRKLIDKNENLNAINKRLKKQLEESEAESASNASKLKQMILESARASSVKKRSVYEDEPIELLSKRTASKKEVYDDEYDDHMENDEEYRNFRIKKNDAKPLLGHTSRSQEGYKNMRKSLPSSEKDLLRNGPSTVRSSHRLSHRPAKEPDEYRDYRSVKSFSARKLLKDNENENIKLNGEARTARWREDEEVDGEVFEPKTSAQKKMNIENQEIVKDGGAINDEEDDEIEFQKYLESNEPEENERLDTRMTSPVKNLKNEIASLDDEIYEIQRCIKEELRS